MPLAMEGLKIWAEMKEELDWDSGYRRGGNLHLFFTDKEHGIFHSKLYRERKIGLKAEILFREETGRLVPTLSEDAELLGGKYCHTYGTANPLLVIMTIA